jgi:DNA-binding LacI/PurR family transcriptional regulator
MLELLANPDTEKRNLILPTELIIRKSTAPRLSDKQKKTDKN